MSYRITCYTLFDITKTGIPSRAKPRDDIKDISNWYKMRNSQSNFDTILQIISLRAQPDVVSDPKSSLITVDLNSGFGKNYQNNRNHRVWQFDFEIQQASVFHQEDNELGALYQDCKDVPMIVTPDMTIDSINTLQTDNFARNIYFVKY